MRVIIFLITICVVNHSVAQRISPYFFAQNAWMPDSLGNVKDCTGEPYGLKCKLWGKINQNNTWEKVRQSGVKLVRLGGEHADENKPTRHQYIQLIDSARSKGIEPLLQVSYNNNFYAADSAAELVRYVNVIMKRNVKFWSIGNEPDVRAPNGYGYFTASPIADYTKLFATKMKAVDSTIITLGPELSYYNIKNNLIQELTHAGGFYDITGKVPGHTYYYLDIITFHSYPFSGKQTRAELISNLRDPWHISHMLDELKVRLDSCNQYHKREGKNTMKIALTETNMNFKNPEDPDLGAHGFIAGQFWCELMAVGIERGLEFVAFWSIIENSLGYIDEKTGKLWPTYHHYKLMADHIKGTYYKNEITEGVKDLKVIAAADSNYISLILLNQKNNHGFHRYSVQIGNATIKGNSGVGIRIKNIESLKSTILFNDSIEDESTSVLVFNYSGTLVKKYNYKKSDGPHAAPKLVKNASQPLFVSIPPDINVPANNEVLLTAGGNENKKAAYHWYHEESETPLNSTSSKTFKVLANKNATYKLVVSYEGFTVENRVNVKVK